MKIRLVPACWAVASMLLAGPSVSPDGSMIAYTNLIAKVANILEWLERYKSADPPVSD